MSEMIERVASAIADETRPDVPHFLYEVARAAIQAMREPTEHMSNFGDTVYNLDAADIWRHMVDAALHSTKP